MRDMLSAERTEDDDPYIDTEDGKCTIGRLRILNSKQKRAHSILPSCRIVELIGLGPQL